MKDRLADGVARVRERVDALRGRDGRTGNRYVLLPAGAGRRRRIAEVGAVAGAVVVVLAFVGATVALRPSSSSSPKPDGPGLPVPTEAVSSVPGSPSAPPSSTAVTVPVDPSDPVSTGRFTPTPTATGTGSASPTGPAPTTRASVTAPPHTTPPHTTASSTPTPTATPTDTSTPTPTETPTTDPADPGDT
jgi:hypothetical protein